MLWTIHACTGAVISVLHSSTQWWAQVQGTLILSNKSKEVGSFLHWLHCKLWKNKHQIFWGLALIFLAWSKYASKRNNLRRAEGEMVIITAAFWVPRECCRMFWVNLVNKAFNYTKPSEWAAPSSPFSQPPPPERIVSLMCRNYLRPAKKII